MLKKIFLFIKKLFWDQPVQVEKKEKIRIPASEVIHDYVIINYKGRVLQLTKSEVISFHNLPAKQKKEIAIAFDKKVKKRLLVLHEIDGKKFYARTKGHDYKKHYSK